MSVTEISSGPTGDHTASFRADAHAGRGTTAAEKRTPRRKERKEQVSSASHLRVFASLRETGAAIFRTAQLQLAEAMAHAVLAEAQGLNSAAVHIPSADVKSAPIPHRRHDGGRVSRPLMRCSP
jgi:hypothetical protein